MILHRRRARGTPRWIGLTALLALALAGPARAERDPLIPMLLDLDRYFQAHEADGVTMDSRYDINPSEAIRQSVVCQVLGYAELFKVERTERVRNEIVEHTDYLIAHLDPIRSYTPFDGMLAYALLAAYEATGEARFLASGTILVDEVKAIPTGQCVLNGGLMVAMATAAYANLTGDAVARQKTSDILTMLEAYQNDDGSFPHWCGGSKDIHYTGWMAEELIHLERMTGDLRIEPMLSRMRDFLEARVDANGRTHYEEPCPGQPGCTRYFYSRATGCSFDYDTRGWTVEPGYSAMLFDHFGSSRYLPTIRFLESLENGGAIPDLWGYWPPPEDPEYPWTIADTSVANMSIVFWTLAGIATGRHRVWAAHGAELEQELGVAVLRAAYPNPAREVSTIRWTLSRPADATLDIHDVAGRRVRRLIEGPLAAGEHETRWDLRDDRGRACRDGSYFAILRAEGGFRAARLMVTR